MDNQQLKIRDQQRDSWNEFAPGWKKWDALTMRFMKPLGDKMIESLHIKPDYKVLDIATGTGEPGISIAEMVKNGSVTGTDLSDVMLKVAAEKAKVRGLSNYSTQYADASELAFDDNAFDIVTCRLGYMFFPDVQKAMDEMYRVLKPGGQMSTVVWSVPEKNPWVTILMGAIKGHLEVPAPEPGAPGLFRCAAPDYIENLAKKSGFEIVVNKEYESPMEITSNEEYWDMMTEVAAPIVSAMRSADDKTILAIKMDVFKKMDEMFGEGAKAMPGSTRLITVKKPA